MIAKLVKMRHTSILIPVIGTLQECASEKAYCVAIMQADGMIADLVREVLKSTPSYKFPPESVNSILASISLVYTLSYIHVYNSLTLRAIFAASFSTCAHLLGSAFGRIKNCSIVEALK